MDIVAMVIRRLEGVFRIVFRWETPEDTGLRQSIRPFERYEEASRYRERLAERLAPPLSASAPIGLTATSPKFRKTLNLGEGKRKV